MPVCNIAILVYGVCTKEGKEAFKIVRERHSDGEFVHPHVTPIDIRRIMSSDPTDSKAFKVLHTENSEYARTMANLLNAGGFTDGVEKVVSATYELRWAGPSWSHQPTQLIPVYCSAGVHRCDGASKVVT
jgi:hypothetical protein